MDTIISSVKTYCRDEDKSVVVTAFSKCKKKNVSVCVKTSDDGIAAVEAFLFFRRTYGGEITLIQLEDANNYTSEIRRIGVLSNELLGNFLTADNKELVACFISCCDVESGDLLTDISSAEKELLQFETSCNTASGVPLFGYTCIRDTGAILTADNIKDNHASIWKSHLFFESTGMDFCEMQFFMRLSKSNDMELVLYCTFLMCLWGQYECRYPYTLYCKIKSRCFEDDRFTSHEIKSLLNR